MGYFVDAHGRHLLVGSLCPGLFDPVDYDAASVVTGMEDYAIQRLVA